MNSKNTLYLKKAIAIKLCETLKIPKIILVLDKYNIPKIPINAYEGIFEYIINRMENARLINLKKLADNLGIDISYLTASSAKTLPELHRPTSTFDIMPANLAPPAKSKTDSSPVKAFISHSTKDKLFANKIRKIFKKHGIIAFVSGEDIKGGEVWRKRIRKEINEMHVFIAMHTDDFSKSLWCQQETGLAFARETEVEIIPINFNKKPPLESFLDEFQYIKRGQKNVETIAREILDRLKDSEKTKDLYSAKIADKVAQKPIEQIENTYSIRSKEVTKKGLAVYKAST